MNPSTDQYHDYQDTLESMLMCTKYHQEKKASTPVEQAQKCPRCGSTDTKFCYYNNYSLSQPRYYCKYCRRYWTKGGTLRNVPVGGGCRNNKTSSSSSSNSKTIQHSHQQPSNISPLSSIAPPLSYDPSDLTLAFARVQKQNSLQSLNNNEFSMMGNLENIPHVTSTTPYVVNHGGFNGVRNSFLENSLNGFGNYVYGNNMNNCDMGYVQNGGEGMQYEDLGGTTSTSTGVMPELQNLRDDNGESRPYQIHDYNYYYYY